MHTRPQAMPLPDVILRRMQEFYVLFFAEGKAGLWLAEFDVPLAIDSPLNEQPNHILTYGFIADCNNAFVRMLGYSTSEDVITTRLPQTILPQGKQSELLIKRFVRSHYALRDVGTVSTDRRGSQKHFLTSLIGIIEDDHVVRLWGSQRDITAQIQSHQRYRSLLDQLTQKQSKVLHLTIQGCSLKEIGHELEISPKTVDTIRHRLIRKMEVESVQELVVLATRMGLDGMGTKKRKRKGGFDFP